MTAVPKPLPTPEEYLARERAADFKSEYYRGETFATAGASYAHTCIADNLVAEIGGRRKAGPCRVLSRHLRVKVSATGLYTYPDLLILCDRPESEGDQGDVVLNPQVILEILSASTERYDRTTKFRHYQQIPTFAEYVLVSPTEPFVEQYVRRAGGEWGFRVFDDPAGAFSLATVDVTVPLAEVYRGVELADRPLR